MAHAIVQWVTQDYISAHMWYDFALSNGNKAADLLRSRAATEMTFDDIEEAKKRTQTLGEPNSNAAL